MPARLPRGISRCSRYGGVSQPPAQQGPKITRISAVRVASALCAVLLLLLLVFILENNQRVWTSAPSVLTGTCRRDSRSCWLASRECCSP